MSIEALLASLSKSAWLPFVLVVHKGEQKMQLNTQRMIEAVIIGMCIALVGYLTVVPRLEERLEAVQESIRDVKEQNSRHSQQGHSYQFTLMEQMRALDARVIRLEKQKDGH